MTKRTMTTEKVLEAWNVLNTAKYSKLDDADKIRVWKTTRALRPVAEKFDEDTKDAATKMKPSEDFDEQLTKAQEYERMIKQPDFDATKLPIGAAEYNQFIETFKKYNTLVNDTVKDFAQKEVEIEVEPLTEESFGRLMSSNDWNMSQVIALSEIIVE